MGLASGTGHSARRVIPELFTPDDEQKPMNVMTNMLKCPSGVTCDRALGKNVFAYDGKWPAFKDARYVVKVFDDDDKLQAEIRAHTVLRKFYEANKENSDIHEPLRFELVQDPKTYVPYLRIERYVPLRDIKIGDLKPKWAFQYQISKMHLRGIAHGALDDGRIGHIGDLRFAMTGSHQVVSPLSDFADLGGLGQEEARAAAILKSLVKTLLRKIEIEGTIDGITDATAAAVVKGHNAFVEAAANDVEVLNKLLGMDLIRPARTPLALGKREAPPVPPAPPAPPVPPALKRECTECGERIAGGIHGSVYTHATMRDKVVKVFKRASDADIEFRAYGVMNLVSKSDPSFRSLRAKVLSGSPARMEIDKFKTVMGTYISADDKGPKVPWNESDEARAAREAALEQKNLQAREARKQARKRDGISKAHFAGLLDQLRILHSHGVAHGDLHCRNVGFIDAGFVIGDPTWLKVSPLSVLYEPAASEDRPVLDALRRVTKQAGPGGPGGPGGPAHMYVLTDTITVTDEREKSAIEFIDRHNKVVEHMRKDREKLLKEFQGLENSPEWSFVFKGLAPQRR